MKGRLRKSFSYGCLVDYDIIENTPIGKKNWSDTLPLIKEQSAVEMILAWDTKEVEFEIVKDSVSGLPYAKIVFDVKPCETNSVDNQKCQVLNIKNVTDEEIRTASKEAWDKYEYELAQNLYSSVFHSAFIAGANWMRSEIESKTETKNA